MPFGDVTKFRAKSCEREENAWVLGWRVPSVPAVPSVLVTYQKNLRIHISVLLD